MRDNIYARGNGDPAPEFAGRTELLGDWTRRLAAVGYGGVAQDLQPKMPIITGPEGIGKHALVDKLVHAAHQARFEVIRLDTLGVPAGQLDLVLNYDGHRLESEPSPASVSESDPADPLLAGRIARTVANAADGSMSRGASGLVVLFESLECMSNEDFTALAGVPKQLRWIRPAARVVMVGTGLPILSVRRIRPDDTSKALEADEFLIVKQLEPLGRAETVQAVRMPAFSRGIRWETDALDEVVRRSRGFPRYVQMHAGKAFEQGDAEKAVTLEHVREGARRVQEEIWEALHELWDDLLPREQAYVVAVTVCDGAAHDEVAAALGVPADAVVEERTALITNGILYRSSAGRDELADPAMREVAARYYPALARESAGRLPGVQAIIANVRDFRQREAASPRSRTDPAVG